MNCPQCGKFMKLDYNEHIPDIGDAPLAWTCPNEYCYVHDNPLEDHTYDWIAYGIDGSELEALKATDIETYDAFVRMRQAYEGRKSRREVLIECDW